MGAAWRDHGATIVIVLLVLPAASVLACRRRRRGSTRRRAIAEVGMVAGSLPWAIMLFTPQPARRSVDLVPLHDLPSWVAGDPGTAAAQIVGNLLVLAALGFFLPLRFVVFASLWRVAAVAVITSAAVEALQWVLAIGRVSSVDDVLINTLGAVAAAAASRRWWAGSGSADASSSWAGSGSAGAGSSWAGSGSAGAGPSAAGPGSAGAGPSPAGSGSIGAGPSLAYPGPTGADPSRHNRQTGPPGTADVPDRTA